MRATLGKKRKDELARFFEYTYRRALALDPRELDDKEDLVRALTSIRAGARSGFQAITGKWLNVAEAVAAKKEEVR